MHDLDALLDLLAQADLATADHWGTHFGRGVVTTDQVRRALLGDLPDTTPSVPLGTPAAVAYFERALDYWRWCWDCGTDVRTCAKGRPERKCCPDCRHRDTGAFLVDALLAPSTTPGDDRRALDEEDTGGSPAHL